MGTNLHVKIGINPSAVLQNQTYRRGMIVSGSPSDAPQGKKIVLPTWIQFVITDKEPAEIKEYWETEWQTLLNFSIVVHDPALDGYRVDVSVDSAWVSNAGLNVITQERVESWLNKWGASVVTASTNNVRFDAGVYNALKSEGFWGRDVSGYSFGEVYEESTGIHTVTVTHPVTISTSKVAGYIINILGASAFVSMDEPSRQVVFEAESSDVFQKFKESTQEKVGKRFRNRIWTINEAGIAAAEAAGGYLEVTAAQAQSYLQSLLDD